MATEKCPHCGGNVWHTDKICQACGKGLAGSALLAKTATAGSPAGTWLLMIAAFGAALLGLVTLSQATMGVGLLCGGCLFAIWARIVQAGAFHKELMKALQQQPEWR